LAFIGGARATGGAAAPPRSPGAVMMLCCPRRLFHRIGAITTISREVALIDPRFGRSLSFE
jgi:hypothetical protein